MSQMPYSPMHGPQKAVTQEDMWATLAKHAKAEVEVQLAKVGESPKEKPAVALQPLQWLKPVKTGENAGYVLDQSGRYSIEKRQVRGKPMYMAWKRGEPPTSLGIRLTRKEAEHLCELEAARDHTDDSGSHSIAEPNTPSGLAEEDSSPEALAMARPSRATRRKSVP